MSTTTCVRPWYREPLVWLLIAPPFAAILAGAVLLYLAISTSDGMVVDDYYQQGKTINTVLRRDELARVYGLRGNLQLHADHVSLRLQGRTPMPPSLQLQFLHATREAHDVTLMLARATDGVYRASLPSLVPGRWHVQIVGNDWRLTGTLRRPDDGHVTFTAP